MGLDNSTGSPTTAPLDVDVLSLDLELILHTQILFKNNWIYQHHLMQLNYITYDIHRAWDSINPNTNHQDIMLLANISNSNEHLFCYARVLGIFHANIIYNGPGLMNYQPHCLEFLWIHWFEVITSPKEQDACGLDILHFVPMYRDDAFGFVNLSDVLRSSIPDFLKGKLHSDCQPISRAS